MDMSVEGGSLLARLFSGPGITAVSHYFVMDWVSVWVDIVAGFLIAGALAAWVPDSGRPSSWSTIRGWPRSKGRWSARS